MLTRRDTGRLMLSSGFLTLLPGGAEARSKAAWEDDLRGILDRGLYPGCKGKLTLLDFDMGDADNRVWMECVIRMDWPPGWRVRKFHAKQRHDWVAFELMVARAQAAFDEAWTGCVK